MKKAVEPRKPDNIAETEAAARAEGKSYGQYQLEKIMPPPMPKRSYRQWTQNEKNEIREMYAQGHSISEIAIKFEADKSKIQSIAYGHRKKAIAVEPETAADALCSEPAEAEAADAIDTIDILLACAKLLGCEDVIAVSGDRSTNRTHIRFRSAGVTYTLKLERI